MAITAHLERICDHVLIARLYRDGRTFDADDLYELALTIVNDGAWATIKGLALPHLAISQEARLALGERLFAEGFDMVRWRRPGGRWAMFPTLRPGAAGRDGYDPAADGRGSYLVAVDEMRVRHIERGLPIPAGSPMARK